MSMWQQNSARIARREVEQWFASTPAGAVFLTADGRVLPLSADEAAAIRARAETKAVEWHAAFEVRAWIAVAVVVTVVVTSQWFADNVPAPFDDFVRGAAYTLYTAHGAWMLYEVFHVMKKMRELRASIAHSLAGRVPIDQARAGGLGKINPVPVTLTGLVMVLFLWNWLAELVSHRGIDLIGAIPTWLPLFVIIFVWIVAIGNKWIDRSRGVGVEPPRSFNSRIEHALDRERTGR